MSCLTEPVLYLETEDVYVYVRPAKREGRNSLRKARWVLPKP